MAFPVVKPTFSHGEIGPSMWGRVDTAPYHAGCSTMRNFFVNYRGGASSRAGTAFVGQCKQSASAAPPRDIRFQFNINQGYVLEFGDRYMRVKSGGAYVTEAAVAITGATRADPCVLTVANSWANGDWIFVAGVQGMTQLNGKMFIVAGATSTTVQLTDLFGNNVNAAAFGAYSSGGTAARIFTLTTPYAAVDLPWLKFSQNADVMSLTCVNQNTGTSYAPQDLSRITASDWTLTATTFAAGISAPASLSAASEATGTWNMQYVMTAVSATTGEESVASPIASVTGANPAITANSITLTGASVTGAGTYNFYKCEPSLSALPSGILFGFIGSSTSPNFVDSNITADFSAAPPTHQNPFSGTGNSPGGVSYFQQRRFYFFTTNEPNTYFASKPGAYTNMDTSPVSEADDAITGTPWAQQVNGIQAMVPMQSGLVILTGSGAWQLTGAGASSFNLVGVTPADQQASPQAYNGCSPVVPPITINYDILYVQAKGSIVRDLAYNFFVNIYTGTDITVLSNHLFTDHQILQWAWAEEPYKVMWAIREDGVALSLTYLREQEVYGWARHDTNGLYVSVCSVTEPPVDAVYFIVKRFVPGANLGAGAWVYYSERMDDRLWTSAEDVWCVDAGLSYPQNTPAATLTPSGVGDTGNITSVKLIGGGSGYVSPVATAIDPTSAGSGAEFSVTVSGGVITAINATSSGQNYSARTVIQITDAGGGAGAAAAPNITNIVLFTASANVFSNAAGEGAVGDVIRCGGGIATVTQFVSATQVFANITTAITAVTQDGGGVPVPQAAGDWSIINPVQQVTGLDHLNGMTVSILADGSVVPQQQVAQGMVSLPAPASEIIIGLPFQAQLQTPLLDIPGMNPTVAGRRKQIPALTIRTQNSRGIKVGVNQPDASTEPGGVNVPWTGMVPIPELSSTTLPGFPIPLITGDTYCHVPTDWATEGQVALQIDDPVPADVLMLVPEIELGDTPSA
jgi:hypothetical protein